MKIIGVDGCPGGWIAVDWDIHSEMWQPCFHPSIGDVLDTHRDAACIGIDIPIGLRDDGRSRGCDVAARALLGRARGSSVFAAPQRTFLTCRTYDEANARSKTIFGKGIARQAFGIYSKVCEVDELMTPECQRRVIEVHPEVSFWAMHGGRAMAYSKKTPTGYEARRALLSEAMKLEIPETHRMARQRAPYAGADDLLDALAVAWTARRHAAGDSARLFANPVIDARGLRMEIVV